MHLKNTLKHAQTSRLFPNISFGAPQVKGARKMLAQSFTEAEKALPTEQLEDLAARMKMASDTDSLGELPLGTWKKAAWCLWLPGYELARDDNFLQFYLKTIRNRNKRSFYRQLISVYLRDYSEDNANISTVGRFLEEEVALFDWTWADRQHHYALFSRDAPIRLASHFATSGQPYDEFLDSLGMTGELLDQGMAAVIYMQCLRTQVGPRGQDVAEDLLNRVLEWSGDKSQLRYPDQAGKLADVLLSPWKDANPPEGIRAKIETFLLEHYKDPRFPTAPGNRWSAVREDTKHTFLRWLVGTALQQFLQVVDKVAMPNQWRYRKAFWMSYYDKGMIEEAWVAFAWEGAHEAKRSFDSKSGFAELAGPGIQSGHAVLLMRLADLTIADWSHNGKCHIWTASNKSAPMLYKKRYTKDALTHHSSNSGIIHSGAAHGTWQSRIESYIGKHTGLRLSPRDYMPRDTR